MAIMCLNTASQQWVNNPLIHDRWAEDYEICSFTVHFTIVPSGDKICHVKFILHNVVRSKQHHQWPRYKQ